MEHHIDVCMKVYKIIEICYNNKCAFMSTQILEVCISELHNY